MVSAPWTGQGLRLLLFQCFTDFLVVGQANRT